MHRFALLKIFIMLILGIFLSGCTVSLKGNTGSIDGGVYKTETRGDRWLQRVLIPSITGKPRSMAGIDSASLAMDPSDNKAVYFGSLENGLFYTYDGGLNWNIAEGLGKITVKSIAVDPSSKCIIYTASLNKVFKSTDCNRTWSQIYYDNDPTVYIKTIAIDHYDTSRIYIGSSRGEVIKSFDGGESWQTMERLDNDIEEIVISPQDSRVIFAATKKKGLHRSMDGGIHWQDLSSRLEEFKDGKDFRDIAVSESEAGVVILATRYGMFKSRDNGDSWSVVNLITPEKEASINAISLSPQNSDEIYYVTYTTFYRSLDGGENWTTKKLPTSRAGWNLLVDPKDPGVIYMGVRKIKN
jgi:photosystem II stability/assembly factor-like uncharacterized protein